MVAQRMGLMLPGAIVRLRLPPALCTMRTMLYAAPLSAAFATRAQLLAPSSRRAFSVFSGKNNDSARAAVMEKLDEPSASVAQHFDLASNVNPIHTLEERFANANDTTSSFVHSEEQALNAASEHATTQLKELGLGGWSPSGMLQHLLDTTQFYTGLPWWGTIVLVTCAIRLSIAPLLVYVQGNSIRLSNVQPQMQAMIADMEYAKSTGNQQEMQLAAMKVRKLLADNNASPFRSLLLPVVQMPIFLSFYFAIDGLAKAKLPALTTGGLPWVPDLTVADPYYVLPVASALMTLLVLETGAETGTTAMNQTAQARMVKNILRGVTVVAAWFVSSFPAALLVYWTTTNTFSLVQLLALRTRVMKRLLKLPEKIEHKTQPHVKQKSFVENLRATASNKAAAQKAPTPVAPRRGGQSMYGGTKNIADNMSAQRQSALDAMLSEDSTSKEATAAHASRETVAAEKQARVAAARERRMRGRA